MTIPVPKQRVPELDGLRGVAVSMVVVFHYISQEGRLSPGSFPALLQRFVIMGWTGVDLFFVLSGFLIGGILMNVRESPAFFKTFYARRFFRIVPIYYLWILFYVLLIAIAGGYVTRLSNSGVAPPLDHKIFTYFLFIQNVVPMTLFGLAGAWFGHLWSLAVEEQFYLLAPITVRIAPVRKLKWFLAAVIASAPLMRWCMLRLLHVPSASVSTWVICRMDALAVGMLAAAFTRGEKPSFEVRRHLPALRVALAVLALGAALLWTISPHASDFIMQTAGFTWMAFFYVIILLLANGHTAGWIARISRNSWLREIGLVSYCIYIIHIVVNVLLHAGLLHKAPRISNVRGAATTCFAAILTYLLAKLSWILLEAPLQKRGHAFKY